MQDRGERARAGNGTGDIIIAYSSPRDGRKGTSRSRFGPARGNHWCRIRYNQRRRRTPLMPSARKLKYMIKHGFIECLCIGTWSFALRPCEITESWRPRRSVVLAATFYCGLDNHRALVQIYDWGHCGAPRTGEKTAPQAQKLRRRSDGSSTL